MEKKVFIKQCYDVKNYESFGDATQQFFSSLSCEKFLERNHAPKFINNEHAKFKSLMCLCIKTHQEVEGLGLPARRSLGAGEKVIHRLGIAG